MVVVTLRFVFGFIRWCCWFNLRGVLVDLDIMGCGEV